MFLIKEFLKHDEPILTKVSGKLTESIVCALKQLSASSVMPELIVYWSLCEYLVDEEL